MNEVKQFKLHKKIFLSSPSLEAYVACDGWLYFMALSPSRRGLF